MALISEDDQQTLTALIGEMESRTEAEIVCVVSRAASDYRSVPLIWASLGAFALPWPLIHFFSLQTITVYRVQLFGFLALALLLSFAKWRFWLVPRLMKRRRAAEAAREQFYTRGMHRTAGRTGVLIYIAEAERYAEILVDDRVATAVDSAVWRNQVEMLTAALRRQEPGDGLAAVIRSTGEILARALPAQSGSRDELPNRIVIL